MESQTQPDPEATEATEIDIGVHDPPNDLPGDTAMPESGAASKKKREKKDTNVAREPGKSLLPFARVLKIIKADKVSPPSSTRHAFEGFVARIFRLLHETLHF
jgi:DNA polymerase epsilon subunit 4